MTLKQYHHHIATGRVIYLTGATDKDNLHSFRESVAKFHEKHHDNDDSLVVAFYCWGGSVVTGKVFFNDLKALAAGRTVYLVAMGEISSMALYLMMAIPREQRLAMPLTHFYFHHTRLSHEVSNGWNLATQHEYDAKEYQAEITQNGILEQEYEDAILRNTKITKSQYRSLVTEPRYLMTKEAVQLGLVSDIIEK